MRIAIDLNEIKKTAEDYYANGDFYCSEAVVKVIRDAFQLPVSDACIKMASGFPVGIGGKGCLCGAVSGGVMAIGLVFGREKAKDPCVNVAMELSGKLLDSFTNNHRVGCCRMLTKGMTLGSEVHMQQCVTFTGEVAYTTAKIIAETLELEIVY
ncbi:MAG: C-GCAxxG-C-C family (seleno)protein [Cellulosilyticaceae bacterium]